MKLADPSEVFLAHQPLLPLRIGAVPRAHDVTAKNSLRPQGIVEYTSLRVIRKTAEIFPVLCRSDQVSEEIRSTRLLYVDEHQRVVSVRVKVHGLIVTDIDHGCVIFINCH